MGVPDGKVWKPSFFCITLRLHLPDSTRKWQKVYTAFSKQMCHTYHCPSPVVHSCSSLPHGMHSFATCFQQSVLLIGITTQLSSKLPYFLLVDIGSTTNPAVSNANVAYTWCCGSLPAMAKTQYMCFVCSFPADLAVYSRRYYAVVFKIALHGVLLVIEGRQPCHLENKY